MMNVNDDPLWVQRYRPQKVADTILPKAQKAIFQKFVDDKVVPSLLLVGTPGTGKTTVARAMLEELGCDYIVINGSLERNIETLRNDIMQYATSMSIYGTGRKYVILDEADYLNPNSFQPALRNFMEEFSMNCGFILTANYQYKIIDPLQSRCSVIEFKIPKDEVTDMKKQFLLRIEDILKNEKVEFDRGALVGLLAKFFPDFRKIINEIQKYSASGRIDVGILANLQVSNVKTLVDAIKRKDFTTVRKWVADNSDLDANELYSNLYEHIGTYISDPASIASMILILARYQYQNSFVANPEINTAAALTEIMLEVKFKE